MIQEDRPGSGSVRIPFVPRANVFTCRFGRQQDFQERAHRGTPRCTVGGRMLDTLASRHPDQTIEELGPLPLPPARPDTHGDTGLNPGLLSDLVLKAVFYNKQMAGAEIADLLCLPFEAIRPIIDQLRMDAHLVTLGVGGGRSGTAPIHYGQIRYELSDSGHGRALQSINQCSYCGPAPVPVAQYVRACHQQTVRDAKLAPEAVRACTADLVLDPGFLEALGMAVSSASSLFLYGGTGNGKSTIAQVIGNMLGEPVWIPYCLEVGGQIVRLLDRSVHRLYREPEEAGFRGDKRWVLIKRPAIVAAGEMSLASLDLHHDAFTKTYEAPLHLKANNGVLVIDDLGRQQVSPAQLLNRWIYPLEHRVDYLTLTTGRQLAVPFDVFVVFCTNLEPSDLADEAFLRRIRHKLQVPNPTEAEFRLIFRHECEKRNLTYREEMVSLLLSEFYQPFGRIFRGSHPRDIVDHIQDILRYRGNGREIDPETLRLAAKTCFVHTA